MTLSTAFGARGQCCEGCIDVFAVALGAQALQLFDLRGVHRLLVDLQHIGRVLVGEALGVDADHRLLA